MVEIKMKLSYQPNQALILIFSMAYFPKKN